MRAHLRYTLMPDPSSVVRVKLSIVLCNYNTRDDLARCLDSILATAGALTLEIIVADNASRDGSADMVRQRFPQVTLIETGTNLWFSGGNNRALRAARGKYALILNPDTVVEPGALQTLVRYLDDHPEVGMATCRMMFPGGAVQRNCSRFPTYPYLMLGHTFLGFLLRGRLAAIRREMWYADWDRESTRAVEVAPGSALIGRRTLLDRRRYFDERLRLYFTEDDLCRRVRDAGAEIHYVAEATLVHREHASVSQVRRLATRIYFDDMIVFARKYYGARRAALLRALALPTRLAMELKSPRFTTHNPRQRLT
jgi:GT2 family glycosyltransferase